ncbi:acyl-CoA dehydratase activase-related protein [Brassicibacter mesophilus]|uniref:acyl-CoA dehydratase activase-related protein n=1 Tax=Brassicibacter mesophilus TaxID=745119 RepID=UPI003D199093
MSFKVGIPQGLLFYDYYPLWKEFLNELDVEVVLSSKTNKNILNQGVMSCVDEACLPVKVFHGHVNELKDKVDYLFIPKIISIYKKEYICPKFLGLPEMVRNSISDLPPIIDIEINLKNSNFKLVNAVVDSGKYFTTNLFKIGKAYKRAYEHYANYTKLINKGVIPIDAIKMYNKVIKDINTNQAKDLSIMVIGHPYNIYDEHISMNLLSKLKNKGINVITSEMIDTQKINYFSSQLPKRMFWSFGRKIVGSAFYVMETQKVNGVIYVSSFGCGLDSILIDIVQRKANALKVPFTLMTIDEHTGEAGINTRLEAFIDMIKWRARNENYISTHG